MLLLGMPWEPSKFFDPIFASTSLMLAIAKYLLQLACSMTTALLNNASEAVGMMSVVAVTSVGIAYAPAQNQASDRTCCNLSSIGRSTCATLFTRVMVPIGLRPSRLIQVSNPS